MAKIEIVKFGACYDKAKNNDKIWGIARINNTLVNFWGRRGATLRFKTHIGSQALNLLLGKWETKTPRYTEITLTSVREKLVGENFAEQIVSDYYSAMGRGTLNTAH